MHMKINTEFILSVMIQNDLIPVSSYKTKYPSQRKTGFVIVICRIQI
jgi:hypothetical protein